MTELLTAAQMRAIEQVAIDSGAVTGLELMERAGRGVVDAILDWRPELATAPHRAVVLCGPGNNGGDGFVVARLLKQRGWEVELFLYGDEAKLPSDAAENARRWREFGEVKPFPNEEPEWPDGEELLIGAHLIVDALFGIGLNRGVGWLQPMWLMSELKCLAWPRRPSEPPFVVAVDMPSGICSDSGFAIQDEDPFGSAHPGSNLCVTFHSPRLGHVIGDAPSEIGDLVCKDIGLTTPRQMRNLGLPIEHFPDDERHAPRAVRLIEKEWVATSALTTDRRLGTMERYGGAFHKYSYGHALILAGGPGKGGAARLAARGALRIGAGLVTVGCPREALTENAARLDAIMLAEIESADALSAEIAARKIHAICIGPGFGLGQRLRAFLTAALRSRVKPGTARDQPLAIVLDADALTEYHDDPETLFAMLHERCVLTPHQGEFGRLFPDILAKLKPPATRGPAYSKVDATREAAARSGCTVLFKGADTVIAGPDGRCAINSAHYDRAAPWLATAGSGDVLAGFITGLLARGFSPMQAAETAAWLHVECALKFGPGLIAEDLPEQLPAVFRDLGQ
ncbi:MAG: NAD(P)H-hydrate dehydratase [Pseudomonadota bacterium]